MRKSISPAKLAIALIILSSLLVAAVQWRSAAANADTPFTLTNYDLGSSKPLDEDLDGYLGTTGKTPAIEGAEPWLVGLIYTPGKDSNFGYFCAGTLISPTHVLTAAHCLQRPVRPSNIEIVVGRFDLTGNEGEAIPAKAFYIHSQWQELGFFSNDIAVIELARPAALGSVLPPITDATAQYAEPGDSSRTVGWGILRFTDDTIPNVPYGADFPITRIKQCRAGYEGERSIDETTICAGFLEGQSSACQGDSGSSLTVRSDDGTASYQAGIVSGGAGCGWISKYGVYTRVSSFNDWVARAVNGMPSADDTKIVTLNTTIPENFLGFTLTELPFGFKFIDGDADNFELFLEYADSEGALLLINAFNDGLADLDEAAGEPIENLFAPDEIYTIEGVQVVILDAGGFVLSVYVKSGNLVFIDGEVTLDEMREIIGTVIRNSN